MIFTKFLIKCLFRTKHQAQHLKVKIARDSFKLPQVSNHQTVSPKLVSFIYLLFFRISRSHGGRKEEGKFLLVS